MTVLDDYQSPPWDLVDVPWRTGRSVGRTIYACPPGSEPRKGDVLIGVMDTPELADEVVRAHNYLMASDEETEP